MSWNYIMSFLEEAHFTNSLTTHTQASAYALLIHYFVMNLLEREHHNKFTVNCLLNSAHDLLQSYYQTHIYNYHSAPLNDIMWLFKMPESGGTVVSLPVSAWRVNCTDTACSWATTAKVSCTAGQNVSWLMQLLSNLIDSHWLSFTPFMSVSMESIWAGDRHHDNAKISGSLSWRKHTFLEQAFSLNPSLFIWEKTTSRCWITCY